MLFDLRRVEANAREAGTEDLLDRVTVFRAGMEPAALRIIEAELRRRQVTPDQIELHARERELETRMLPDGTAARCSFCHRPALAEAWGWHRLWGRLPLFPRRHRYCREHMPSAS